MAKATKRLHEYGNITNSVNYPDCDAGVFNSAGRIAILHKNIPKMLTQFTCAVASLDVNISDMVNKSRETMLL